MATDTLAPVRRSDPERKAGGGLFRAFWRWHFYAAFIVAPILLVLATTGLIYLLRFQLEPLMHADVMKVEQPAGTRSGCRTRISGRRWPRRSRRPRSRR